MTLKRPEKLPSFPLQWGAARASIPSAPTGDTFQCESVAYGGETVTGSIQQIAS
jgi:hypothetical protein